MTSSAQLQAALKCQRYGYHDGTQPTLVLLHGWGCDSAIWQPLIEQLQTQYAIITIDLPGFGANASVTASGLGELIALIKPLLPSQCVVIGWSLGGMLAMALAHRCVNNIVGVVSIAANLKFVTADDWLPAMPKPIFDEFYAAFAGNASLTLKRFAGLQAQGDSVQRSLTKALRDNSAKAFECVRQGGDNNNWQRGLDWLAQWDMRPDYHQLTLPGLHVVPDNDALVPVAVVDEFAQNTSQRVEVISDAGHAFFFTAPEKLLKILQPFLQGLAPARIDKAKVAASFSKAAAQYDQVAHLQRAIGHQLLLQYPLVRPGIASPQVLDLGCGTGFFADKLQRRLPTSACVTGCDISPGMINYARHKYPAIAHWLVGDAEQLTLHSDRFDLVFSSLAIQWCEHQGRVFSEMYRVLKPGGSALIATLGPNTLHELRQAWEQVDHFVHVNHFPTPERVENAILAAGFEIADWHHEALCLRYETVHELMRELKVLGAHNVNSGQPKGLTGRARLHAFEKAYSAFRDDTGLLPATYDVHYLFLQKPA